jgi:hypothetical protein
MKPLLCALAVAFCVDAAAAEPFAAARLAPSVAPAPAAAPALPFRYVGRLVQAGRSEVLLMRGDRLYSVGAGQRIGDEYVLERIGRSSITFTYVPLNRRQRMDLPGVF